MVRIELQQFADPAGDIDECLRAGLTPAAATHWPLLHGHGKQRPHAGHVVIWHAQFAAGLSQRLVEFR